MRVSNCQTSEDWYDPQSGATVVSSDRQSSLMVYGFDDEDLKTLAILEEVAGIDIVVAAHDPDLIALPAFAVMIKEGPRTTDAVELVRAYLDEISGTDCAYYLVTNDGDDWRAAPLNIPGQATELDLLATINTHYRKPLAH